MATTLYRKGFPGLRDFVHDFYYRRFLGVLENVRKKMLSKFYLIRYSVIRPRNERERILYIFGKVGITAYPYLWIKEYQKKHIDVRIDGNNNLPYVMHHDRRLYYKQDMAIKKRAEKAYRSRLIEQDIRSAHRYVDDYKSLEGKVLFDVGAAEADFTLDVIDYIDHAYLFECDEDWVKALEATFAPWKDKVTIVRKYVSDTDDDENITVDRFMEDKSIRDIFLKMDIEGYELKALRGCAKTLQTRDDISGAVCIYHKKGDPEAIQSFLAANGYSMAVQPGVLYFEKEFRPAIVRFYSKKPKREIFS